MIYFQNYLLYFKLPESIIFLIIILFPFFSFSQSENVELKRQIDSIYIWNNNDQIPKAIRATETLIEGITDYKAYDKAVAYTVAANVNLGNDSKLTLEYLTKVLQIIDENVLYEFTPQTKMLMAAAYADLLEYDKAFKLYHELIDFDKYVNEHNRRQVIFSVKSELVRLNQTICRNRPALDLYVQMFNMELDSLYKEKSDASNMRQYLALVIANIHGELGNSDSMNLYIKKHEQDVFSSGKDFMKFRTKLNEGNQAYRDGNFERAIAKYKEYGSQYNGDYSQMYSPYLIKMSRIYLDLGKIDSAQVYLNYIADSPSYEERKSSIDPEFFELSYEIYNQKGDEELSAKYLKDFVFYLEKFNNEKLTIMEGLHDLDTQELQIKGRDEKNQLKGHIKYLWFAIAALLLFTVVFMIVKQKQNQKKFKSLMNRVSVETDKDLDQAGISQTAQALVIKDEKVAELIHQIAQLNEEGFFLKQKTTLYNTAKKLKTNTSYLSNVINNHLNTTFNAFVNEIRINYVVNELKNNSQMRQYSVKAIAEEIGYKSADSFTKYFKQNTGLSPSLFIRKVNKEY